MIDAVSRQVKGKEPTIVLRCVRCGQVLLKGGGEVRYALIPYLPSFLAWSMVLTGLASLSASSCGLSASLSTEVSLQIWNQMTKDESLKESAIRL